MLKGNNMGTYQNGSNKTLRLSIKFMDLSGKEIENPRSAIYDMNRSILRKKINYQGFQPSTQIGIVELWGRRNEQEDRIAAGELLGFDELTEVERLTALEKAVVNLQDIITQLNLGHQGSTFCSTVLLNNQVYTTNLGDGTAFLCIIDSQAEVSLELLNTRHNPDEPSEFERLKRNKIRIINNRLAGSLAVSRALGDQSYEQFGLTHIPEINRKQIEIPKEGRAFIINACDGLTESDPNYYSKRITLLKEIIRDNYKKTPNEIATSLALAVLDADVSEDYPNLKVGDNISVMVVPVDVKNNIAIYMLVCDGHGGDAVADAATQLYEAVITHQILLAKLKDKDIKFVDLITGLIKSNCKGKDLSDIKSIYLDFNTMLIDRLTKSKKV